MDYTQDLDNLLQRLNDATIEEKNKHGFDYGYAYIQQSESAYKQARRSFLALCAIRFNDPWYDNDEHHPAGIIGRYLSESDNNFYNVWYRLGCIDTINFREWGQMFFALNPLEQEPDAIRLKDNNAIRKSKIDPFLD